MSNPETAQNAPAPPSAFSQIFARFGEIAATSVAALLQTKVEGEVTRMQAKNDIKVQQLFDEAGRTNDVADANRQAVEQTELLFGFLPVPKGARTVATWGFVLVGILLVVALVKGVSRK